MKLYYIEFADEEGFYQGTEQIEAENYREAKRLAFEHFGKEKVLLIMEVKYINRL